MFGSVVKLLRSTSPPDRYFDLRDHTVSIGDLDDLYRVITIEDIVTSAPLDFDNRVLFYHGVDQKVAHLDGACT